MKRSCIQRLFVILLMFFGVSALTGTMTNTDCFLRLYQVETITNLEPASTMGLITTEIWFGFCSSYCFFLNNIFRWQQIHSLHSWWLHLALSQVSPSCLIPLFFFPGSHSWWDRRWHLNIYQGSLNSTEVWHLQFCFVLNK